MGKDNFFNFNKKSDDKKSNFDVKKWGLNIQKREYQDIVESHLNRPEEFYKRH